MKIYKIHIDMDNYNYFVGDLNEDVFDGRTLKTNWAPYNVKVSGKKNKNGDFKNHIATVY